MNVANLYRTLKQILRDSNLALSHRGITVASNLNQIPSIIENMGGINRLKYFCNKDIITLTERDLINVKQIKERLCAECKKLSSVTIPHGVTSIGDSAFYRCTELKNIIIPNSATSIGDYAFYRCTSLTSITIPNSVTSIGGFGFYDCSNLTDIIIPNGVTTINGRTFSYCSNLSSIIISDSVTDIGSEAFSYCKSLENITMPESVTYIGGDVFKGCNSLKDIYLEPTTPPTITSTSVVLSQVKFHVPIGSGNAYKSATNWSNYADKIVEDIVIE